MKSFLNLLILFVPLCIFNSSYAAGIYDDWPDEAICLWLEQRPNHEGYLDENKKRDLNCFEREDFHPRDFVHVPLNLTMY